MREKTTRELQAEIRADKPSPAPGTPEYAAAIEANRRANEERQARDEKRFGHKVAIAPIDD